MKKYSESSDCVKCGRKHAETVYDHESNALKRTCRRCGHVWWEGPLDRGAP